MQDYTPSYPKHIKSHMQTALKNLIHKPHKNKFNCNLLPSPKSYYQLQFPGLALGAAWVTVSCCFHPDNKPSLSINTEEGNFKCHSCGAKGGDIVTFHMLRYQMKFIEAAKSLGAWEDK